MIAPSRLRASRSYLLTAALVAALLLAPSGPVLAQSPPSGDQGPRFGQWGPGRPPPAAEVCPPESPGGWFASGEYLLWRPRLDDTAYALIDPRVRLS